MAHPFVQLSPNSWGLRQPEIGFPPQHEATQPLRHRAQGSPRHTGCKRADAVLERLDRLVGDPPFDRAPRFDPEGVTEKFAAKDGGNGALGLVHRQVKSAVEPPQQGHHPLPRSPGPHINVAVVGVAAEGMAPPFKFLIHLVQQQVGQQRRQRPALRRAPAPLDGHIPIGDVGVQIGPDQADDSGVRDSLAQTVDQDVVVDPVEELFQVHIHHDSPPGLHERLRRKDGVVRTSARAEAVAVLAEGGIKDRLEDLQERLLDQAVQHRGDAKLALAAPRLRDHHAAHRLRPVRPLQKAVADGGPGGAQHLGRLVDVQTVHTRRALVGPHLLQCPQKVLSRQDSRKQSRPRVVRCPGRGLGFVKTGALAGFTRRPLRSPGRFRHLTHGLTHPPENFTLSRSVLRLRSPADYYDLC